jgi:outer membrane protein TolC
MIARTGNNNVMAYRFSKWSDPSLRLMTLLFSLTCVVLWPSNANADELTFARALKIARQRAPEIKAAKAGIAITTAQLDTARTPYWPTLTAVGTGQEIALGDHQPVPPPSNTPFPLVVYTTAGTVAAQFRWTVLDFGKTSNAVTAAEATRDASVASAADVEANLISTVANGYLDVVYGEKIRDIEKSIVDDREKSVLIVKALVKQGLTPVVEELRAHSRVEVARRDLEAADAAVSEARVGLLAFLGLDPTSTPTFSAPQLPHVRMDNDRAEREAEEKKPAVLVARSLAASNEANVDASRARYYPSVNVNGDASYRLARIDTFDANLTTRNATGTLLLTIPLYDASIGSRLDEAKADAAQADANYEQAKRDARTEAARALVVLTTSERILEHAKKAAEAAATVLAVIRARFAQGISSTLDLIDAETTDADARISSVRSERALDGAAIRLLVATGKSSRLFE